MLRSCATLSRLVAYYEEGEQGAIKSRSYEIRRCLNTCLALW